MVERWVEVGPGCERRPDVGEPGQSGDVKYDQLVIPERLLGGLESALQAVERSFPGILPTGVEHSHPSTFFIGHLAKVSFSCWRPALRACWSGL